MKTSSGQRDYRSYRWKKGEKLQVAALCFGAAAALSYFFYRSVWALIPLSGAGGYLFWREKSRRARKARDELAAEFRECILSVVTSLQAGYSVENAFMEAGRDMELLYGKSAAICEELEFLRRGLHINISIEELLTDIAGRSGCEDIGEFAQIFALAKRNGGNMAEIIKISAGRIGRKIELKQELRAVLGGRRLELTVMKLIPFGILLYIEAGNPGYFAVLYHNLPGVGVMTGCLGVYLAAYFLGEKIMDKLEEKI